MFIAVRKEQNGSIYLDKNIYSRMETLKLSPQGFEEFKKENATLKYIYETSQEIVEKQVEVYNPETPEIEPKTITKEEIVDIVLVTKKVFTDEQLSQPPYNYKKVEIDDKYSDCTSSDFNEDLTFNVEKYNARKQKEIVEPRIVELKKLLASYDYIGVKIATGRATKEEYAKEIAQMTEWANEINELEQCKYEVKNALQ